MSKETDSPEISLAIDDETCAWVALHALPNLGYVTFYKILERLGSIRPFFTLSEPELLAQGCQPEWLDARKNVNWHQAAMACEFANQPFHHLVTWRDDRYPFYLRNIANPPPVLFGQGEWSACQKLGIAIVGSRKATLYGKKLAFDFAAQLSDSGLTIISGLALGIDSDAHTGCLSQAGSTIAVLGTGLGICYPKQNKALSEDILAHGGLLLSEFLPYTPPQALHFPRRNRIISGLSIGVLVVEATQRSGSLITARLANEQGREVFAIPHQINHPLGEGCHRLIQQGAKLVYTPDQILDEFPAEVLQHLSPRHSTLNKHSFTQANTFTGPPPLAKSLQKLLALLGSGVTSVDDLNEYYAGNINKLASDLALLEVQGRIMNTPQGYRTTESH